MGTLGGHTGGSVLGLEASWVQIPTVRLTQLATRGGWPPDTDAPCPHLKDEGGDGSSIG